jgi:predicted short-subunit dehydrogenase-like oxidoreductase (DUF2520 family)
MISASNFLCTIDQLAEDLAVAGGVPPEQARLLLSTLQTGALETIAQRGGAASLTGPIERGDLATCEAMMSRIRARANEDATFSDRVLPVLSALAGATVSLAQRKQPEDADRLELLRAVFEERAG